MVGQARTKERGVDCARENKIDRRLPLSNQIQ